MMLGAYPMDELMKLSVRGKRIFWLGMHKILVQTELVRLRKLGYEVFNPPYLSNIQDQSAQLEWDATQQTTLPKTVFERLSQYNFFYNEITSEIAEILNEYFDAVVVTISPRWLASILKTYHGRVIYRTFGQHFCLSEELRNEGLLLSISGRRNFVFMPHAKEALSGEHAWLSERANAIPYCLPEDIMEHAGQWTGPVNGEVGDVAVTCPNIDNAFFRAHYDFLKKNFCQPFFKYFGVQLSEIADKQVVGTLSRSELIERFKRVAGYLYTYTDSRVCYLPPIEMMVLGGPVLFLKGSLLDSYFGGDAPGRCADVDDAHEKVSRLIRGDRAFIDSLLASQAAVVRRYHPDYVWPLFDAYFSQLFEKEIAAQACFSKQAVISDPHVERIYLLHHFPGQPVVFDGKNYSAYDGIPRVMRQIVQALHRAKPTELWITARYDQAEAFHGFFAPFTTDGVQVRILVVDDCSSHSNGNALRSNISRLKRLVKQVTPQRYWPMIGRSVSKVRLAIAGFRRGFWLSAYRKEACFPYVDQINDDERCAYVIVPHYYFFPEALSLNKDIYLYLPDYMPHFFHDTGEFIGDEGEHTQIGRAIAKKARAVFCNSEFTREYLPESRLGVDSEKIRVFYLPLLNTTPSSSLDEELPLSLISGGYIFYPTQPRPNKNLSFLLRVFESLVQRGHDLRLVLTCKLDPDPKALAAFRLMSCPERVVFMPHVSDELLSRLYRHAALLCFTSLAEGNFPPQIQEAIVYDTPVVSPKLGFVTERIPKQLSDALVLCRANDLDEYVDACEFVLGNRALVLDRQRQLREVFLTVGAPQFEKDVVSI